MVPPPFPPVDLVSSHPTNRIPMVVALDEDEVAVLDVEADAIASLPLAETNPTHSLCKFVVTLIKRECRRTSFLLRDLILS